MNPLRTVVRWFGYDLVRRGPPKAAEARQRLLASRGVTLTLDVGANTGQFAKELRRGGFGGRIVSFEPLSEAFRALSERFRDVPDVTPVQLALGATEGTAEIHVAGNSQSSSLLPMLDRHVQSAPDSRYVGTERVQVSTVDKVLPTYRRPGDRVFLKIDTQGYEKAVLDGAKDSLRDILAIQLELSLVPLYEGAPGFEEMLAHLRTLGYQLVWLERGFGDAETGQLLQVDALFMRAAGDASRR